MTRYSGAWKIARFNWPWYVAAIAATLAGLTLLRSETLGRPWAVVGAAGILAADFWLLVSLAVSHYIYDRSTISHGGWLSRVDPATVRSVAVFHAGQDEASETAARALPSAEIRVFDFYDPARNGSPSLKRARALAKERAAIMAPDNIPLKDQALDLALIIFAAHEIRKDAERIAFFSELARVLAPGGRALLVEHLRNGWNFLAYGPGAFHFLSRKTWNRSFDGTGLHLLGEVPYTRFVRLFELGKAP